MASLPYHEPSLTQLLSLSSFLLALNIANAILDRALYCGLVGQVLIGVAWGLPGAGTALLSVEIQDTVVQLGYIGLVLMVFEGGAATSVDGIKRDLALSAMVALTGVAAPVALGFAGLGAMLGDGVSKIQCFAAGAALASTSLGTTFAVLSASGLAQTRLGSVLGTAAMMDDVLGLVMVQIVAELGGGTGEAGEVRIDIGEAVIRPVLVSLGFAVAVPMVCRFVLRPLLRSPFLKGEGTRVADENRGSEEMKGTLWWQGWMRVLDARQTAFITQTILLVALVVAASFAGASVLLAAYLAGIVVSWWGDARHEDFGDSAEQAAGHNAVELTIINQNPGDSQDAVDNRDVSTISQTRTRSDLQDKQVEKQTGSEIYELYYSQPVAKILKPFFFASIGFSIPISDMFSGEVVWRGIIYSILMAIGKMLCGLWLMRFPISMRELLGKFTSFVSSRYRVLFTALRRLRKSSLPLPARNGTAMEEQSELEPVSLSPNTTPDGAHDDDTLRNNQAGSGPSQEEPRQQPTPRSPSPSPSPSPSHNTDSSSHRTATTTTSTPAKPLSLYPAAIMSSAMIARGEIGFLISAVAESNGVFRRPSDGQGASTLFLIVTWAIVLCTIIGPVCVGLLVRRVKKLEGRAARTGERSTRDVLGAWGVL